MNEMEQLRLILQANKKKDFIKRILYKEKSPELSNSDGSYATHAMEYSTHDRGAVVYPTVVRKKGDKHLTQLSSDDAYQYAMENNEFIELPDEKYAEWFSDSYNKGWPSQKSNKGK